MLRTSRGAAWIHPRTLFEPKHAVYEPKRAQGSPQTAYRTKTRCLRTQLRLGFAPGRSWSQNTLSANRSLAWVRLELFPASKYTASEPKTNLDSVQATFNPKRIVSEPKLTLGSPRHTLNIKIRCWRTRVFLGFAPNPFSHQKALPANPSAPRVPPKQSSDLNPPLANRSLPRVRRKPFFEPKRVIGEPKLNLRYVKPWPGFAHSHFPT